MEKRGPGNSGWLSDPLRGCFYVTSNVWGSRRGNGLNHLKNISFHNIFRAPKSHFSPEKSPGVLPDVFLE